jgi:glycosyltransferase involved in cell wall biosynthesis
VTCAGDITSGVVTLKARHPEDVVFRDLAVHLFRESCKISVVITCNRFLQRLRVALRNWCHQDAPPGTYEILVVNPGSPDGTREHIRAVARSFPEVRICEIAAPARLARNKGALINYAIPFARGEWIWLTDADCVFSPSAVGIVRQHIERYPPRLFFGERRYLTGPLTDDLLAGRADGVSGFEALAEAKAIQPPEVSPWGYTQIVPRAAFERVRYNESFNHFAHSDGHFVESCKRCGLPPEQVPGLVCLHLDHPFAWYGSSEFL